MQHAAVVAALMFGRLVFLFENQDARTGEALAEAIGRGQPHDAASDDDDALGIHGYRSWNCTVSEQVGGGVVSTLGVTNEA